MTGAVGQLELGIDGVNIDEANVRLREAIGIRVDAHRRRRRGAMSVHEYLTALRWVRGVEDELEPIREAAGYYCSRAYELGSVQPSDYYMTLDEVLHPADYRRPR
jgi:hypothetical protein